MRFLLALAAALIVAQPAAAATVTAELSPGDFKTTGDQTLVVFSAAAGEANRLSVHAEPGQVRFVDEAPVTAGSGCEQVAEREVVCRPQRGPLDVSAVLRDGDDRAAATGAGVTLVGGPGADQLTGGPDADVLDGGPGADALAAGDGDDQLLAADAAPGEAPDRLDGGAGADVVSFASGSRPVTADLGAGQARIGEKVVELGGVEAVVGSRRDDRLLGGTGDDRLYGFQGDDVLDGRGGDDRVTGGGGRDTVRGGPGDDRLELFDEANPYVGDDPTPRNRFDCGPGADKIQTLNDLDSVSTSCERFAGFSILADPRRRAPAHLALAEPSCPVDARCREILRLDTVRGERHRPRTRLQTHRYFQRAGGRARRVRVGRASRATLRRERARLVLVRLADPADDDDRVRFLIRLP